jgi:hypothetical protein
MTDHKPTPNHFFADNKKFETDHTSLKGLEIKTLASVPANEIPDSGKQEKRYRILVGIRYV